MDVLIMNHDDLGNYSHSYVAGLKAEIAKLHAERTEAKRFVIAKHASKGSAGLLRLAIRELHARIEELEAELTKARQP